MTLYRFSASALLLAAAVLLGACQPKSADDSKVLATVNGQTITENEVQHYSQLRQSRSPVADPTKEQKAVLDEMVDRTLLAQRASETGVDKDPEVQYLLRRMRENILVQAMIRSTLKENPITDEELKERFQKEAAATHKTEYRVRHILLKNEDEAKEVIQQLKGGKTDFAKLAKQKSIDVQSGKRGGDLGSWINQGDVVPEFFAGVSGLQKGAISSEPVKSDFGWHVIKVEDTRPAKIPNYEQFMADRQTKANFYRKLQDEKIEQMVKDLRTKAKIKFNEQQTAAQ